MCMLLIFLVVELSSDSYIYAVPKGKDTNISAVPNINEKQQQHQGRRIRLKNLFFKDNTEDYDVSDTTEDDKEVIIAPKTLFLKANRSKSTLDWTSWSGSQNLVGKIFIYLSCMILNLF